MHQTNRKTYDLADRLTFAKTPTDTASCFYDPFGQLRFEDHTDQPDRTYPYDATGDYQEYE